MLGRIALLENKPSNKYHDKKVACFYLFESVDDQSVAEKLFENGYDWAHKRGLNQILGPKGLSSFDGYGFQVEGFEHRQMMTMMNYNLPYTPNSLRIGIQEGCGLGFLLCQHQQLRTAR